MERIKEKITVLDDNKTSTPNVDVSLLQKYGLKSEFVEILSLSPHVHDHVLSRGSRA